MKPKRIQTNVKTSDCLRDCFMECISQPHSTAEIKNKLPNQLLKLLDHQDISFITEFSRESLALVKGRG